MNIIQYVSFSRQLEIEAYKLQLQFLQSPSQANNSIKNLICNFPLILVTYLVFCVP